MKYKCAAVVSQNLDQFGDGVQTKDKRETGRAISIKRSRKQTN